MSDPLIFVITTAGRAALVNAANTGTGAVTVSHIGVSATAVVANAGMTVLAGELKRLVTFGGSGVSDDTIHVTLRDESTDVYSLRSFALYLNDGTLFGLYGQADPISEKTAASLILLSADIKLADIAAATIEFGSTDFQNPPATETVMGVLSLATNAEASAGTNATKAITPKTLAFALAAWLVANFSDVWKASNDGSGSGLDADLLDGQHGAYYLPVASYTAADVKAKMLTQDGAGSTLDADLLDGQQGAYYADPIARMGFTPVNVTNYTAADVKAKMLTVDGAGSTLDADLLDGQQGAYYADIEARLGYTPANLAGDTFTGRIKRDDNFFMHLSGTNPYIQFDAGDYLLYDRVNDQWRFYIGSSLKATLSSAGSLNTVGGYTAAGQTVWNASNDGAGSGLDADLLDGQQASYYLAASGYTAADVKAKMLTQDGSGSTLDADLLDGQHGSYYTAISARLGYTPLDAADYTAADVKAKMLTQDGSGSTLDADLLDGQHGAYYLPAGSYTAADVKAKLVTVDGSGSGLDADLLDGLQASAFALLGLSNSVLPAGSNANGTWFKIGNLIIQCGMRATIGPDTTATVTYPLAMTNAPFFYIAGTRLSSFDSGADSFGQIIGAPGTASMTVDNQRVNNSATIDVPWLIIAWD